MTSKPAATAQPPMPVYVAAGNKPWSRQVFDEVITHYPGVWRFVATAEELKALLLADLKPRYLFFLHWSDKVPRHVFETYECVCFHMAPVPYGRGGSPLQNLIQRGHHTTKLTALRMVTDFDAGPVYLQEDLSLEGNAEEIYLRATRLSAQMILRMIQEQPVPQPQTGEPTMFARRKPAESRMPALPSLEAVYDHIRMLDAEGYPHAFLDYEGFRYEFRRAAYYHGRLVADVTITPIQEPKA